MPDTYCTWNGLSREVGGNYTLAWGTNPGQARITGSDELGQRGDHGTLEIVYRDRSIKLRDCLVVDPTYVSSVSGPPLVEFTVLDRRWRWQFAGTIDGDYNKEVTASGVLQRERTPQDLAAICFEAMGESRYDVSELPSWPRPRIVWDCERPIDALNALCNAYGCVVCFDPVRDGSYIVRIGDGPGPPFMGHISRSDTPNCPPAPQYVEVASGAVLFQTASKKLTSILVH